MTAPPKRQANEAARRKPELRKFKWLDAIACNAELAPVVFRVAYLVRCVYGDNETGKCDAAMDTIAHRLEVNEKTVRRAVEQLEKHGYLAVTRRGWNHTNVLLPTLPERTKMSIPDAKNDDHGADIPVPAERTFGGTEMSDSSRLLSPTPLGRASSPPTAVPPEASSPTSKVEQHSTLEGGRRAPDGAPAIKKDEDYHIPGIGYGWIDEVLSVDPAIFVVCTRNDENGIATFFRVELSASGSVKAIETVPENYREADHDAA